MIQSFCRVSPNNWFWEGCPNNKHVSDNMYIIILPFFFKDIVLVLWRLGYISCNIISIKEFNICWNGLVMASNKNDFLVATDKCLTPRLVSGLAMRAWCWLNKVVPASAFVKSCNNWENYLNFIWVEWSLNTCQIFM